MRKDLTMGEPRFAFGKNWKRYSKHIGSSELTRAKLSLVPALADVDIEKASFLDIGSGSGLFSRAAYELGFARVVSFDFDFHSVEATNSLRQSSGALDEQWRVLQGSVLDPEFMRRLGSYDLVYSWGVLHHTGAMWLALDSAAGAVKPGGILFIALYNDQGWLSHYWRTVKRVYVNVPVFIQLVMVALFSMYFSMGLFFADLVRLRNPFHRYNGDARGMKMFIDIKDWVGGYPFEVAQPQQVVGHLQQQGFSLVWQRLVGRRHGCNEFVFRRVKSHD